MANHKFRPTFTQLIKKKTADDNFTLPTKKNVAQNQNKTIALHVHSHTHTHTHTDEAASGMCVRPVPSLPQPTREQNKARKERTESGKTVSLMPLLYSTIS